MRTIERILTNKQIQKISVLICAITVCSLSQYISSSWLPQWFTSKTDSSKPAHTSSTTSENIDQGWTLIEKTLIEDAIPENDLYADWTLLENKPTPPTTATTPTATPPPSVTTPPVTTPPTTPPATTTHIEADFAKLLNALRNNQKDIALTLANTLAAAYGMAQVWNHFTSFIDNEGIFNETTIETTNFICNNYPLSQEAVAKIKEAHVGPFVQNSVLPILRKTGWLLTKETPGQVFLEPLDLHNRQLLKGPNFCGGLISRHIADPVLANYLRSKIFDYKIHLMPFDEDIIEILTILRQNLIDNPTLQGAISLIKIKKIDANEVDTVRRYFKDSIPRIVIYIGGGKQNAEIVLNHLLAIFGTRKGLNTRPEFNAKLTSLIYFAQGDREDKILTPIRTRFFDEQLNYVYFDQKKVAEYLHIDPSSLDFKIAVP